MLDFSDGLELGTELYYFIPPLLLLIIVPIICATFYALLFKKILPVKLFNFFVGPIVLLGLYIWAIPMKIGFYEFFRSFF